MPSSRCLILFMAERRLPTASIGYCATELGFAAPSVVPTVFPSVVQSLVSPLSFSKLTVRPAATPSSGLLNIESAGVMAGRCWSVSVATGVWLLFAAACPPPAPFFLPWNQVDLILRKSGQPFFGALVFQIRAILKNQSDSQKQLK